jgi:hypothetical protein
MLWLNYIFVMSHFKNVVIDHVFACAYIMFFFASWWIRPILLITSNQMPNMIDMHTRWSITIFIWQHSLGWPLCYSQYSDAISLSMFPNYLPYTWPILIKRCGFYRSCQSIFCKLWWNYRTVNGACDCWSLMLPYFETLKLFYWSKFERKKCT